MALEGSGCKVAGLLDCPTESSRGGGGGAPHHNTLDHNNSVSRLASDVT